MSQIQVDNIYNKEATGSPSFPLGANVTGVITATTFKGGAEITSGTISATSVTAASGTFNGPVTIGGTLTYEDVTNIDSVGVITARNGVKVNAGGVDIDGGGIDITGNIGLGGANYGTAGQVLTSGGSGANATWTSISAAPEITANAAENINAGKAVSINGNGQFAGITSSVVAMDPATFGTDIVNLDAAGNLQQWPRIAYDPDNNIVYAQGKALTNNATRTRTLRLNSDGSWGTPNYEGELSNANYGISNCCYAGQGRFVACYRDGANSFNARVITVNTTTMVTTVSSEITVSGSDVQASNQPNFVIWHPPTNKILFVVRKNNENYYRTYTGSMNYSSNTIDTWASGSDYPLGTDTIYLDDKAPQPLVYDPDTEKIIFCATRTSGNPGGLRAVAITVASNGSVTFGTEAGITDTAANPVGSVTVDYDTFHNKLVFAYRISNTNDVVCRTASVAANGTITPGTAVTASTAAANTDWITLACNGQGQFGVFWRDQANLGPQPNSMICRIGTISANGAITYSSQLAFLAETNTMEPAQSVWASNPGRIAIIFPRGNGYTYLTSAKIDGVSTNAAAYVGIANTTATSGQSLVVRTFGGTSSVLSGLSTGSAYYIQTNGNLSTTADTPSVIAGVALNGTTMLVKS